LYLEPPIFLYIIPDVNEGINNMFRIIAEGLSYKENVLLKNGQGIILRPARPEDLPDVESFMKRVSHESLYMRFMAAISAVSPDIIKELCAGDFKNRGCLLAKTGDETDSKVIGLGNYVSIGNGRTAEVAFLIEDNYQGKGIGTLMLERLAGLAVANGFVEFEAEVLSDNQQMINVFKSSGFERHQAWSSDTVHIELPVDSAAALWEITGLRERIAAANSLYPLLRPKVIAVIGASRDTSSIGNIIFKNILSANFSGTVYPVNPHTDSLDGVKAFPKIEDIPDKVDLAVIAVKAEKVYDVAVEAIRSGVKGLIVVSAGFADAGEQGLMRQRELTGLVRSHGVRLLGPSCLGVMNTDPKIKLNASMAPKIMPPGHTGFFSHSAALGLVILEYALEKGVSFTTFVSAGNRADVSGNDLLQYWEEDPNTKMAVLYLETFGNPRRFVRIARRMTGKKPILCIKSGKSLAGRKTTELKSGIITKGEREVDALFQQTGIILAPTLEDLFDVAVVLVHQPLPKGNRVSIIANSSGVATLFADACEINHLNISGPGVIDLGAFTSPDKYGDAVKKCLISDEVDALLVGYACVGECSTKPVETAIRNGVNLAEEKTGIKKTVLLCIMGAEGTIAIADEDESSFRKFPAFRFPESAVNALGRVMKYVEYRKKPSGKLVWFKDVKAGEARTIVQNELASITIPHAITKLDKNKSILILDCFGIHYTDTQQGNVPGITIRIKPDPLFGPLIEIESYAAKSIVRITPLTDMDLEETLEEMRFTEEKGIREVLGRLSQMIEAIPWLWEFKAEIAAVDNPFVTGEILFTIKSGGAERPSY
jgi:acyl-CoA synthetase (NDP forming)/RimJ/RimL family protein N-acetyltransferase